MVSYDGVRNRADGRGEHLQRRGAGGLGGPCCSASLGDRYGAKLRADRRAAIQAFAIGAYPYARPSCEFYVMAVSSAAPTAA